MGDLDTTAFFISFIIQVGNVQKHTQCKECIWYFINKRTFQSGRVIGAGLYFLGKNKEVQEKLFNEIKELLPNKNTPITAEILKNAKYLKATVKELLRFSPILVGLVRDTTKEMVIGGYKIPKGVSNLNMQKNKSMIKIN